MQLLPPRSGAHARRLLRRQRGARRGYAGPARPHATGSSSQWRGQDETRARQEIEDTGRTSLVSLPDEGRRLSDWELAHALRTRTKTNRFNRTCLDYRKGVRICAMLCQEIEEWINIGHEVGPRTYAQVLSVFAKLKIRGIAERMWAAMKDRGVKPSIATYSAMMAVYAKQGDASAARAVLSAMRQDGIEPDDITIGSLLHAYARAREEEEMFKVYKELSELPGFKPTVSQLTTLISGCQHPDTALDLVRSMRRTLGVLPSVVTYNAALNVCVRSGDPAPVREVLHLMTHRHVARSTETFNILMRHSDAEGGLDAVLSLLADMDSEGLRPNDFTYIEFIRICSTHVTPPAGGIAEQHAERAFRQAKAEGLAGSMQVYTNLMSCYAASGNAVAAHSLRCDQVSAGIRISDSCEGFYLQAGTGGGVIDTATEVRASRSLDPEPRALQSRLQPVVGRERLWQSHQEMQDVASQLPASPPKPPNSRYDDGLERWTRVKDRAETSGGEWIYRNKPYQQRFSRRAAPLSRRAPRSDVEWVRGGPPSMPPSESY